MTSSLAFPPEETPEEMIRRAAKPDGSLDDLRGYLWWYPRLDHPEGATLDGVFTAGELRAIADWMDTHMPEKKDQFQPRC
jgi:hypothetical protein